MGVRVSDERPYEMRPLGRDSVWIYDFGLQHDLGAELRVDEFARDLPGRVRAGLAGRGRERRLQPPRPCGATHRARDHDPARDREVPAPGGKHLQPGIHGGRARRAPGHRPRPRRAVRAPARPGASGRRGRAGTIARGPARRHRSTASRASTRTGSCAASSSGSGRAADELLPGGRGRAREAVPLAQARSEADPGSARAAADVRDLRLLAAGRGGAPARRQGRPRRHPLVGPHARTSAPRCSA